MPDFDFYYDDVVHCGIERLNRRNINFLIGKNDRFIAKLSDNIIYYHLERKNTGSSVFLLCKDSIQ